MEERSNLFTDSCFLICMKDDSIEGIYDTLKECVVISKSAGLGCLYITFHATGSCISGTNGTSNGIVPMLRVFNDTACYVDQGGGKRKGAFAVYLELWHADIFEFLDLGKEEHRARDLFYGLWVPDLFMQRVQSNEYWSLFCPSESPGLLDCWGEEFEALYAKYEREDTCNRKSNQQNLESLFCMTILLNYFSLLHSRKSMMITESFNKTYGHQDCISNVPDITPFTTQVGTDILLKQSRPSLVVSSTSWFQIGVSA